MKRTLLSVLVANLSIVVPVAAQERMEWSGSVSAGARYVDDDAKDPSKLNEYRDLDNNLSGIFGVEVRGRSNENFLNFYGENLGRDDQYLNLDGGRYNVYRYRFYADQLRHNFGQGPGALSPFSGIGGATLTATLPNTNPATWGSFDHSYKRRDAGGMVEWQAASPWYFRVDTNEVRRDGVNVLAGAKGTSPGNGFMDLPAPIDWTTRNYALEAGHSTRRSHFAVNLSHSTFSNENDVLRWQNDFFGNGLDTTILPPDNQLTRLAVNGTLKQLPVGSTLGARFTYSRLTNDVEVQPAMLSTGGVFRATSPNEANFRGDVTKMTLGLALNSHPTQALDTKLYFNWLKEENDSTRIAFSPAAGSGLTGGSADPLSNCNSTATNPCVPEMFEYEKRQLGAETGYRLNRTNKLSGGLEWTGIERERADFQETEERRLFAEWKNSSLDWLTGRVKYQLMMRRSDFNPHVDVLAANPMDLFVRRFDAANVNQNLVKLALDLTPAQHLDFGFEFIYKQNDYKDTPLGRTEDQRHELYASIGVGDPSRLRVFAFGDVEYVKFDSRHRVGTATGSGVDPASGAVDCGPPALPTCTFNWTAKNEDNAWQIGLGAEWKPRTRLTLKASVTYMETDGSTDFAREPGGPTTPALLAIRNVDDTRRSSLNVRAVYDFTRQWEFTAGYAFEKYRYSDISYDGTRYVAPAAVSATCPAATSPCHSYTTGQFAFQNYTVNLVYGIAKYKF